VTAPLEPFRALPEKTDIEPEVAEVEVEKIIPPLEADASVFITTEPPETLDELPADKTIEPPRASELPP